MWEAGSIYESFGGGVVLALDGTTVTASGAFHPAADPAAEPVDGDLIADC